MGRRLLPAALAVALLLVAPMVPAASQEPIVEEFDRPPPEGWFLDRAEVSDGALWVLDGAHAYLNVDAADIVADIHLRREAAGTALVVYRWRGPEGGVLVGIGDQMEVSVEVGDRVAARHAIPFSIPVGEEVIISMRAIGDEHTISIDGTEAITFSYPGPHSGTIGFITERGGGLVVRSLRVAFASDDAPAPSTPGGFDPVWVRTGGPLGGLGYDVRMRPDDPDVMLVSDGWAGMFMSTDGGATWFPSNEGITVRAGPTGEAVPVFSVTIDPHDPDVVWAGTQYLRGIFKSTDGGRTWVKKDTGVVESDGISFRGFTVDPRSSNVVYAAAEVSSWAWAGEERLGRGFDLTQGVVYRTTDGGESWTSIWRGDDLARYVWIDPTDPDVIYISTGIFDREAANSDPSERVAGGVGVVKSTDGGDSWTVAADGLESRYIGSLFMHPENPQILLAGAGHNAYPEGSGVYRSTDGAASWTKVLGEYQGAPLHVHSVEFATSDPDVAYAASDQGVWRSDDAGVTWRRQNAGDHWGPPSVRVGFPIDVQVDPRDADRLFINAYGGGNFASTDAGRTWHVASTGYTGAQVRGVVVDPEHPGRVWAVGRSGMFVSNDGGTTWAGASPFGEWPVFECMTIEIAPDGSMLEADTADRMIAYGHGSVWSPSQQELPFRQAARALAFAPSDPNIAYAGIGGFFTPSYFDDDRPGSGVLRSTNGGRTWVPANDSLTDDAHVGSLAVHPTDPGVVFAGTTRDSLLRTADGGATWATVPGLGTRVSAIRIDPRDGNRLLAGSGGIFRSTDGGVTWARAQGGPAPESYVVDFAFDPTDASVVYAADILSGVYRSEDRGASWAAVNDGLRTRGVWAIDLSSDGRHLYAATEGEGVWRLDVFGSPPPAFEPPGSEQPASEPAATSTPTTTTTTAPPTVTSQPTAATSTTTGPAAGPPIADRGDGTAPWIPLTVGGGLLVLALAGWVMVRARRR